VLGSTRVQVAVSERDAFQPDPDHGFDETFHEEMTFADYVGHLMNPTPNRRYYLNQQHLVKTFPAIAPHVRVPDYIESRKLHSVFFWFGSQGVKSPLHYDWKHNLLAQVTAPNGSCSTAPSTSRASTPTRAAQPSRT
jgi:hypothetical protein